jgi:hypothetical protein
VRTEQGRTKINYSFPLLSIGCVGEPEDEGEVVDDVLAPVGEMALLRAIATETREEHLVGESIRGSFGRGDPTNVVCWY